MNYDIFRDAGNPAFDRMVHLLNIMKALHIEIKNMCGDPNLVAWLEFAQIAEMAFKGEVGIASFLHIGWAESDEGEAHV